MNYRMVLSKLNFSILVLLFLLGFGGCSIQTIMVAHDKLVSWSDEYKKHSTRDAIIQKLYGGVDDWVDMGPPTEAEIRAAAIPTKWTIGSIRKEKDGSFHFYLGNDIWEQHDERSRVRMLWGDIDNVEQPFKMAALAWFWWLPFVFWFALGQWIRWLFKNDPKGS